LIRHYHYYHFIIIFIFFKAMFVTPRLIYAMRHAISAMPLRRRLSATPHYAAMPPPPDYASDDDMPDEPFTPPLRHIAIIFILIDAMLLPFPPRIIYAIIIAIIITPRHAAIYIIDTPLLLLFHYAITPLRRHYARRHLMPPFRHTPTPCQRHADTPLLLLLLLLFRLRHAAITCRCHYDTLPHYAITIITIDITPLYFDYLPFRRAAPSLFADAADRHFRHYTHYYAIIFIIIITPCRHRRRHC
jgi:hypothetical protein